MEAQIDDPADAAGQPNTKRLVSFDQTLSKEISSEVGIATTGEDADAKFAKRLQRQTTLDPEAPPAAETLPVWLMNVTPDNSGGDVASTQDIMDEFIQDEDMITLEKICSKWQGLKDSEVAEFGKLFPDIASNILLGGQHVSDFLNYRRQLNEKHARKASVKNNLKRKTLAFDAVAEEDDEDKSDSDQDDDADPPSPTTPAGGPSAGGTSKGGDDKGSARQNLQRRKSVALEAAPQARQQRRFSVLSRAGNAIIGNGEVAPDTPIKRQNGTVVGGGSLASNNAQNGMEALKSRASAAPSPTGNAEALSAGPETKADESQQKADSKSRRDMFRENKSLSLVSSNSEKKDRSRFASQDSSSPKPTPTPGSPKPTPTPRGTIRPKR